MKLYWTLMLLTALFFVLKIISARLDVRLKGSPTKLLFRVTAWRAILEFVCSLCVTAASAYVVLLAFLIRGTGWQSSRLFQAGRHIASRTCSE